LEASSGLRRCELAGARRDGLDLDAGTPHPDTISRRSSASPPRLGLPEIDLHEVRHIYTTAGRDAKIDWKALSQRIGHADVAFTMKQYVQADLGTDRQVANTLAELIIGDTRASVEAKSA
jgi:integrase